MKLYPVETGNFKLDGGAMFGAVPKSLWSKAYEADENNLVNLAMRALLVVTGGRRILTDNGLGEKLDEKFLSYYFLNGDETLEKSLNKYGFSPDDITDVVMTHLHFDHCGGGVRLENGQPVLTFKNAIYWTSKQQWDNAMNPNAREKSSYLKLNLLPILESGHLKLINKETEIYPGIKLKLYFGHTIGMVVPLIHHPKQTVVYVADLIPVAANIPLSWISAYDIQPLYSLKEKQEFLNEAVENNYLLFFEHDIYNECCTLKATEKGVRMEKACKLR